MSDDLVVPEIDTMVHEPARLRLLTYLSLLERADFVYLLGQSGLSKGNLSVQMGNLAEAGLVRVEKEFVNNRPRTTYALTTEGRARLAAYRRTLAAILDALPAG